MASAPMILRSWIAGRNVPTLPRLDPLSSPALFKLFDASTGKERPDVAIQPATETDVEDAVLAASKAQRDWAERYSPADRARVLRRAADAVRESAFELGAMETLDTGRPISETSTYDAPSAADCIEYYASVAASSPGGRSTDVSDGSWAYLRREPLGVGAGIGAWNYPLQGCAWKSAPCLAFGNAMVYKPSELTARTALRLAEIYSSAGLPDGLFNVVLGGGDVGAALVAKEEVAKVSFTGSVSTGRKVYQSAAGKLKKATLELGGKSPLIIFDDADLDEAVSAAMMANWYSSGQVCSNGTRVFVHRRSRDDFMERLIERTMKLKIGDPMDPETQIGPMITEGHMEKVLGYIQKGKDEGAKLAYGGERIFRDGLRGYFLSPAIFVDCSDSMAIVQDEIFGMVMSVLTFESEEDVLCRANGTEFGLAGGIFTNDLKRAHRMAKSLHAGVVWINNYNIAPAEMPWGGWKNSGIGKECGLEGGLDEWTRIKSVYVEMGGVECPYY